MKPGSFEKSTSIPDTLYKYVSVKRALEILLNQEIYFALRSQFNDPLEGTFSYLTQEKTLTKVDTWAQFLECRQEQLDQVNLGLFSMSERYNSYPMWAHYAEQHKGCCLEFDFSRFNQSNYNWEKWFPFVFVGKIGYSGTLPLLDATETVLPHEKGSIYMTKFKHWEYEEEWRAVMYNRTYEPSKELFDSKCASFKADVEKHMKGSGAYKIEENFLSGIILGNEMKDSDKKTIIAAAKIFKIDIYNIIPIKHKADMELDLRK